MNEDYLWDKSGEPDAEIERLENTLGRLRYQRPAEPLPLPATSRWSFRHSFSPQTFAIAATLLLLLLAGGLWLGLQRRSSPAESNDKLATTNAPEEKQTAPEFSGPRPPLGSGNPADDKLADGGDSRDIVAPETVAPNKITPRKLLPRRFSGARELMVRHRDAKATPSREQLAREGEQAKAQLIMALHIASDKLNAVQKKIHTNPGT